MGFLIWLALMVFFYTFAQPIFWILVAIEAIALAFLIIGYLVSKIFGCLSWVADTILNIHRVRMRYSKEERRYKMYLA